VSPAGAAWRKSSHSNMANGCVAVAVLPGPGAGYVIGVRDSKNPAGPVLTFAPRDWQEFTSRIKASA
jgi:hypothetical protein